MDPNLFNPDVVTVADLLSFKAGLDGAWNASFRRVLTPTMATTFSNQPVITVAELRAFRAAQEAEWEKTRLAIPYLYITEDVRAARAKVVFTAEHGSSECYLSISRYYEKNRDGDPYVNTLLGLLRQVFPDMNITRHGSGADGVIGFRW